MNRRLRQSLAFVCFALLAQAADAFVYGQSTTISQSPSDQFTAYVTSKATPGRHPIRSFEIALAPLNDGTSSPVVTALAGTHDGKFLAAAGDDHAIRIIDLQARRVLHTLEGHIDWIQSLAFASDSQTLYSCGDDGRVLKWSQRFPVEPEVVIELPYSLRSLTCSHSQGLLAVGGFSNEILLLDSENGNVLRRLACDCNDQRCVRFSPDGKRILCGSRDGELRVWNTKTGQLIAEIHEHTRRIRTASFSVDGRRVASAGEDRLLVQYDLETQTVVSKHDLAGSKLMSLCMVNNDLVAVAGADNSVHLFDALADEVVADLNGHIGTVAVMTPCGDQLASGSFDTTIRIWDLNSIDLEAIGLRKINGGKPVSHAPIKMDARLRIR
ncbi:MAG: WD40 repeat domain-containing protein [Aureliella sp.]